MVVQDARVLRVLLELLDRVPGHKIGAGDGILNPPLQVAHQRRGRRRLEFVQLTVKPAARQGEGRFL